MTSTADWTGRVGDAWAAEWRRTDRSFADLARHLDAAIAQVAPVSGRAIDIGCGAGATSLALAAIRPELAITGIDLSEELVAVARQRLADRRLQVPDALPNLHFRCGDAVALAQAAEPAGLIISRHGLMFFSDPVSALAAIRAGARGDAKLVFSCFDDRALNRFATIADEATGAASPPAVGHSPGPFAFSDMDRVASWLVAAGWRVDSAARVAFDYVAGEEDDPVADALSFLSRIGAAARPLAKATTGERQEMLTRLAVALAEYRVGDHVILPASAWIWRASAAAG